MTAMINAINGIDSKPINYKKTTKTPNTEFTRNKEMDVNDYFAKTKESLVGKDAVGKLTDGLKGALKSLFDIESEVEYDQESINDAMWAEADKNNDGYLDDNEYETLYKSAAAGGNSHAINPYAAALVQEPPSVDTEEEFEALQKLYDADKGLDADGDDRISRDEFENAAINYILTDPDRLDSKNVNSSEKENLFDKFPIQVDPNMEDGTPEDSEDLPYSYKNQDGQVLPSKILSQKNNKPILQRQLFYNLNGESYYVITDQDGNKLDKLPEDGNYRLIDLC